jgi:hypothetical protein
MNIISPSDSFFTFLSKEPIKDSTGTNVILLSFAGSG